MKYNMEKKRFEEEMSKKSKILGVRFSVEQIEQFYKYMNLLIEWDEKMNLTAITEPKEIILKHFIDSITILKYIDDNSKLVDVGTGAGFPGVPLSIMNPTLKITLVDSLNKRLIFLQEVVKELNLKNIEIVHARAEEFGQNKNYREKFDIATSRAVANLATLSEYLVPLVKIGGKIISMKASNAKEEIKRYLKVYRDYLDIEKGYEDVLFLNKRGTALSRVMVFNIIKHLANRAGIKKNVSPHTFRPSFASHLVSGGADLRAVQDMLGHESILTTEIYTHLDDHYLKDTINKFHPRSKGNEEETK